MIQAWGRCSASFACVAGEGRLSCESLLINSVNLTCITAFTAVQEGVVPSMYCTHWFNTIFAYSLPFEQLLRVWDVFLLEGLKVTGNTTFPLLYQASSIRFELSGLAHPM
eukprot:GHUV01056165.1.p1 GENE.GHUV01056165.1~~GHUV01056165.1.p1  ORF type:complete len:110 (+),score=12.21 GHUV01056165.1:82-411(+)